jgi:hypothetical protein
MPEATSTVSIPVRSLHFLMQHLLMNKVENLNLCNGDLRCTSEQGVSRRFEVRVVKPSGRRRVRLCSLGDQ